MKRSAAQQPKPLFAKRASRAGSEVSAEHPS
jgi:hypothetical protein